MTDRANIRPQYRNHAAADPGFGERGSLLASPCPSFFSSLLPFSFSFPPFPLTTPFPSQPFRFFLCPSFLSLSLRAVPTLFQLRGLGERRKLPQRRPGPSPGRKSNFGISGAQKTPPVASI